MIALASWTIDCRVDAAVFALVAIAVLVLARRLTTTSAADAALRRHEGWLFAAAVFVASAFGAEWAGHRERARLQAMVEGFAPTYAHELRRLGILDVGVDTADDDPVYLRLIEAQKSWLGVNPAVADIYTFARRGDGRTVLVVDSETDYDHDGVYRGEREQRTEIGEPYDAMTEELEAAFAGTASFEAEPTTDRWGTWVTALVPIRRDDGSVQCVLGVDYPADEWVDSILLARGFALTVGMLLLLLGVAGRSLFVASVAKARAAAKADARQQFLAHMSHEIRTPMTAILGHADLLGDGGIDADERDRCIATIQRSGQHLISVLDGILDYAKLESGALPATEREVSAREIVDEVLALHTPNASAKDLVLRREIAADVPAVIVCDPRMLRQILLNLVGNAVKFTVAGGIDVDVRSTGTGADGDPTLRFIVRDTGPGIGEDERALLFQPFSQGNAGLDRRHGGTGLGLSISRQLACALGGDLRLTSPPGCGAEFTLELPLRTVAAAPTPPTAAVEAASLATLRGRILVVDDGQDNRLLLSAFLRKAGLDVSCVVDGLQCLHEVVETRAQTPDLILMDVQMPGLDGRETTQRLRAAGVSTPIVAVTAHALEADRAQCLAIGCDDFLTKPVDRRLLLATVERLLAAQSPGA